MITALGAVWVAMVAVVQLGNGWFPPGWRGDNCLTAGICPDPENSPAPMGVNSHEGELWPGQVIGTRKGDAPLVRQG